MRAKKEPACAEKSSGRQKKGAAGTGEGRNVTLVAWNFGPGKGKDGYLNDRGEVAIPPQFDGLSDFVDGMADVRVGDNKYGVIGTDGKFLLPPKFEFLMHRGGRLWTFDEGGRDGLVDIDGEVLIPPTFHVIGNFVNGVAKAAISKEDWGFINVRGEPLTEFCYDYADEFRCGLGRVKVGNSNGFLDNNFRIKIGLTRRRWFRSEFFDGLVSFREDGRVGFMNTSGRVVTEPQFTSARNYSKGIAWVRSGREWGIINKKGEFVSEPKFAECDYFSEGLAWVRIGRLWGAVDRRGEFVFEPKFAPGKFEYRWSGKSALMKPRQFSCGLARVAVKRQGECRFGYVDRAGEFRIPPVFSNAGDFHGGVARALFRDKKRYRPQYWQASLVSVNGEVLYGPHKGEVLG